MTRWQPSLKWHLIALGILLALCIAGYGLASWATNRLPARYQPRTTAQGTTPWND
jgi:hypothetical protein